MSQNTIKVAVVGSGLAGLTAAYLLSQTDAEGPVKIEVHIFEKEACLGMDSSSVTFEIPEQKAKWHVDVPMRSFQGGYYPRLISLYKHLGVNFRQADFSYSFSSLALCGRQITANVLYNGASGREGLGMPSSLHETDLAIKSRPHFVRFGARLAALAAYLLLTAQMLFCYVRLLWLALPIGRSCDLERMTFRRWAEWSAPGGPLARYVGLDRLWADFTTTILVPLFSAVCTAPKEDVMSHPIEEFLDYIWLTLGTHHYFVDKGIRDVVARLTAHIPPSRIHLSAPVFTIRPSTLKTTTLECGDGIHHGFSHVIFATQAKNTVPVLSSYLAFLSKESRRRIAVEEQIRCLRTFLYRPTIVTNHVDETLLPGNARDRRDLNLVSFPPATESPHTVKAVSTVCVPPTYTMTTQILPRLSPSQACFPQIYQTTNPIIPPSKDKILSVARIERAVVTVESKEALRGLCRKVTRREWRWLGAKDAATQLGPLQGAGAGELDAGIWICGSFAHRGIPLLEGCVVSAANVVKALLESEGLEARGAGWTW